MNKSENIAALAAALVAFQGDMKNLPLDREVTVKTKTGGAYKFKYATFAGIIDAARPVLKKHGLAFSQLIGDGGAVTTLLIHESGEYISSTFQITPNSGSPQEIGSAITYAKRYALAALLGIAADDDDDANIAQGNQYQIKQRNGAPEVKTFSAAMFEAKKDSIAKQMQGGATTKDILKQLAVANYTVSKQVEKMIDELALDIAANA